MAVHERGFVGTFPIEMYFPVEQDVGGIQSLIEVLGISWYEYIPYISLHGFGLLLFGFAHLSQFLGGRAYMDGIEFGIGLHQLAYVGVHRLYDFRLVDTIGSKVEKAFGKKVPFNPLHVFMLHVVGKCATASGIVVNST
jgi:hypothetical protein